MADKDMSAMTPGEIEARRLGRKSAEWLERRLATVGVRDDGRFLWALKTVAAKTSREWAPTPPPYFGLGKDAETGRIPPLSWVPTDG